MIGLALSCTDGLGGGGRDERYASRGQRSRASGCGKCALQEAASFGVEIVEQLLAVELEIRTIAVIACSHSMVLRYGFGKSKSIACGSSKFHAALVPIAEWRRILPMGRKCGALLDTQG
jgi:hypothetical protein